jgi:hypothetical protein
MTIVPKEYEKCLSTCPQYDSESTKECKMVCEKVFESYKHLLKERYQKNPEKLDEVVKNAPLYTSRKREDRQGLLYNLFHYEGNDIYKTNEVTDLK